MQWKVLLVGFWARFGDWSTDYNGILHWACNIEWGYLKRAECTLKLGKALGMKETWGFNPSFKNGKAPVPKTRGKFSATHRKTNKKIVQAIHCEPVKQEGIFQDTGSHRNQGKKQDTGTNRELQVRLRTYISHIHHYFKQVRRMTDQTWHIKNIP